VSRRALSPRAGALVAGCAVLLGMPAGAGEFRPPAGCQLFLTVQSKGCQVSNFYRCEAEPAGHQWRSDFGINGREYDALIDAEAQWLRSRSYDDGIVKVLEPGAPDPASFSGLLATGYDSMEFRQTDSAGLRHHYKGHDRLVGETVIDGVPLKITEYEVVHRDGDGNLLDSSSGSEFVHPELGRFLSGKWRVELANGEAFSGDGSPVDFILPGEPGFAETIPLYQCTDVVSSLHLPAKEPRHEIR
jgi:hypothetical protein